MTDTRANELLSAWLDGEASDEERRRVEEMLRSDEARAELGELRRLSELVRALPRRTAPPELASAILRGAERAMLLEQPVPVRRSRRAAWLAIAGGLAATAAAVLLMSGLLTRQGEYGPTDLAYGTRSAEEADKPAGGGFGAGATADTDASPPRAMARAESGAERTLGPAEADEAPGAARRVTAAGEASDARPSDIELAELDAPVEAPSVPLGAPLDVQNWSQVEVGQVVRLLESTGDRVAVVECTVVDVNKTVDSFQFLCAQNSITPVNAAQSKPDRQLEDRNIDRMGGEELAVYVEATPEQMAATLARLNMDDAFREILVQRPVAPETVEVAYADEPTPAPPPPAADRDATLKDVAEQGRLQSQVANTAQNFAGQRRSRALTPTEADRDRAKPEGAEALSAPAAPASNQPPQSGDPEAMRFADMQRAQSSFQMRLNVPSKSLLQQDVASGTRYGNKAAPSPGAVNEPSASGRKSAQSRAVDFAAREPGKQEEPATAGQSRASVPDPAASLIPMPPTSLRVLFVFRGVPGRPASN